MTVPSLTDAKKLIVRNEQFKHASIKDEIAAFVEQSNRQLDQLRQKLQSQTNRIQEVVGAFAKELEVDVTKLQFDLDNLEFTQK